MLTIMYRTMAFLPLSPARTRLNHGTVLLRIVVYAVALSLFLLLGWLAHRLLSPARTDDGRTTEHVE